MYHTHTYICTLTHMHPDTINTHAYAPLYTHVPTHTYIYICTLTHTCTPTNMHMHPYTCTLAHSCTQTFIHAHACICTLTHTCTHPSTYTYMHMYPYTHMQTPHTYTYIHMHPYPHMHPHTFTHIKRGEKISFTSLVGNLSSDALHPRSQVSWVQGSPSCESYSAFCTLQGQDHRSFLIPPQPSLGCKPERPSF